MKKQRKHYTPEEKVAILRRHLVEEVPISDLCDELGLQPTVHSPPQPLPNPQKLWHPLILRVPVHVILPWFRCSDGVNQASHELFGIIHALNS